MKHYSKLFIALLALLTITSFTAGPDDIPSTEKPIAEVEGKITISGAFALYPLAVKWGEEFKKLHPKVTFDIQGGGAGKGMTDALTGTVYLGMVSREIAKEETAKGAIGFAVAKDAVVATFNASNPYYAKIYETGITKEQFYGIWMGRTITTWGQLLKNGVKEKITVYTRSDAAGAADAWAKYIGGSTKKQDDLEGIGIFGDPGMANAVATDKLSIGFNNVGYAYDFKTKKPNPGVGIVPIDLNGNGKLDPEENFYSNADKLNLAVLAGIYPSPPARNLYFVTKGTPTDPATLAFLRWVLTDGQKYVAESGFVELEKSIIDEQIKKLPAK
ncbi:MAG: PstS family phosphate ABC transporter substrate-binding protein [Chitinophagales bacterium]